MFTSLRCIVLFTASVPVSLGLLQAEDLKTKGFQIGSELSQPWGMIQVHAESVEFHVESLPADRTLSFPRLNNEMKRLFIKDQAAKDGAAKEATAKDEALRFTPLVESWQIVVDKKSDFQSGVIVFETKQPIQWSPEPVIVAASSDRLVVLPAHHAVTHGKLLRYEPQPHKNTIGYWADASDWAEWKFEIKSPGKFEVEVLQGCGKGHGGSEVAVSVADQSLKFAVEDTGHFQNFIPRRIGTIAIDKAGVQTLQVRAINKAKGAVCDIRQIRLLPVAE